jgi:Zn-dependent protease with chaperone function
VRESLGFRAAVVAAAAIGFWVLAVGLVLALAAGGVAIVTYAPDQVFAALVAFALAVGLAFGLLPGLPRRPPEESPPLGPGEHPRLHALVREVAAQTGARPPEALYVFASANAFAGARRPRALGPKQDTVGVGLPLLATLTERELRAVVAHEMGHHVRGDVRLGPWIHRTRRTIARAVDQLEGSSFWFHLPFALYADFFMKTSVRISRAQELAADAMAGRVAGAAAMASALRKTEVLASAWQTYFELEVLPVISHGRLPPLLEGFDRYWHAARMPDTPAFLALTAGLESSNRPAPDDTHPTLEERIAALGDLVSCGRAFGPPVPETEGERSAIELLDGVAAMEERVVRDLLKNPRAALQPVTWDRIAEDHWLPVWRETLAPHSQVLRSLTVEGVPQALASWEGLARATREGPNILSPAADRRRLGHLLAVWLVVRAADRGFRVHAQPGFDVFIERNGRKLAPFLATKSMAGGVPGDWAGHLSEAFRE